ncbi:MAG: zf-HC2 domain-containing protein [Acidobacteriia bacterium]|nr:zf-HC2 domain-containing protein [Terriglobia bacterium]
MKCKKVRERLGGYLDGAVRSSERARLQQHLAICGECREELERYRKLSALLSRKTAVAPPADLAVRIRLAAAQEREAGDYRGRLRAWWEHVEVLLENAFKPLAVPATGGLFSAMLVFVFILQLIMPGVTVRAVQNDVPTSLLRPAELLSLSEYPIALGQDQGEELLALPHGLLVDVTVDEQGQMIGYRIISGPDDPALRRQLDQLLLFSRFRPMMSFGRPTAGGHVILSFSEVRVRG